LWEICGNFQANLAKKRVAKNGLFCGNFSEKILLETNRFCIALMNIFNKNDGKFSIFCGGDDEH